MIQRLSADPVLTGHLRFADASGKPLLELNDRRLGQRLLASFVDTPLLGDRDLEGVDILTCNTAGLVRDFMVMVRPYSAATALREAIAMRLATGAEGCTVATCPTGGYSQGAQCRL